MKNFFVTVVVFSLAATVAKALYTSNEQVLTMYVTGPSTIIAGPGSATNNPSQVGFGSLLAFDQPLRKGIDPSSKYLGQARGMVLVDGNNGANLLNLFTCDFTNDEFNGTITFSGSENLFNENRTVSIVGGTGDFSLPKGYLITSPIVPAGNSTNIGTLYALYLMEVHYVRAKSLTEFYFLG